MKYITYDLVFLSNIPAFYKIALYNRIAEKRKILVVFLRQGNTDRNADFYNENANFESICLNVAPRKGGVKEIFSLLRKIEYRELVIGGWDELAFWVAAFFSSRNKNAVVVESSYLESATTGIKALIKRFFLSRISKAYCSGVSSVKLVEEFGFHGKVRKTGGVGLYRRIPQPAYEARVEVKNFIYVGRLTAVKNPEFLVRAFAQLPDLILNIVGFGEQEAYLKSIAPKNVIFHGAIANKELPKYYQKNDVFILASISEAWGMVVEEALNNGLPVMLSDSVGSAEDLLAGRNVGMIFTTNDIKDFCEKIKKICNVDFYNSLRRNVSELRLDIVENAQVDVYGGGDSLEK